MKRFTVAAVTALSACASYEPVRETTYAQLVSGGCGDEGEQMLVQGYVQRAYENTVVIWDGSDASSTVAANLPRTGIKGRLRGLFGADSKNQVAAEQLNAVAQQRIPVTFTLACEGKSIAPQVRSMSYTDSAGQRVAIAY
jgi:hypothetical protein